MKKFATFVSRHPYAVLLITVLLAIPAAISALRAPINYDIFSYLPDSVEAIRGQFIMKNEFKSADTAFVMLDTDDTPRVLKIKDDLSGIEGVEEVSWITDMVDPAVPDSFIPEEILNVFKKDGHSLLQVSFAKPAVTDETLAAIGEIKSFLNTGQDFTGMPVFVYELKHLVELQKTRSVITAVVVSAIMVAIATGSVILPIIFLTAIGIGIIFNMGTNFLTGSISYLTAAVAAVIQLGVTFDFSIFLNQRFREERQHEDDPAVAMSEAIHKTFGAICPAALTTIAGFMALGLMKVRIGMDMGLCMSKGVFIGLVASITVLPALLLVFDRFMRVRDVSHTAHHHNGLARWIADHAIVLSVIFVLLFIPTLYARSHTELSYSIHDMMPTTLPAMHAIHNIEDSMGSVEIADVLIPEDTPRWQQRAAMEEIGKLDAVEQAVSLAQLADPSIPESFIPPEAEEKFVRGGYAHGILRLTVKPGTDEGNEAIAAIRDILAEKGIEGAIVTGTAATSKDLVDISQPDIQRVNLASLLCILLIVAIVFGSASIPVILIAGIQLAIFINLSIPYMLGHSVPYVTFTAISSIQLGTTVDYAILLMSRYRQERKLYNAHDAVIETITGTTPAILTSGLSLFAATIGLVFISDVDTVKSLALMIGRGALISMSIIVVLLPAVIRTSDGLIRVTSRGWKNIATKKEN